MSSITPYINTIQSHINQSGAEYRSEVDHVGNAIYSIGDFILSSKTSEKARSEAMKEFSDFKNKLEEMKVNDPEVQRIIRTVEKAWKHLDGRLKHR